MSTTPSPLPAGPLSAGGTYWPTLVCREYGAFHDNLRAYNHFLGQEPDPVQQARLHFARHRFMGFLRIDPGNIVRDRFPGSAGDAFLLWQENNDRTLRAGGAGRKVAAPDFLPGTHGIDTCFLCAPNVFLQQRGIQLPRQIILDGAPWNDLVNPFVFGDTHDTVATASHLPQDWAGDPARARHLVAALLDLVRDLPGFAGLYNGLAGASIPNHLHLHRLENVGGNHGIPLLQAAEVVARATPYTGACLKIGEPFWPVTCYRCTGDRATIVEHTVSLMLRWREIGPADATENLMVVNTRQGVALFFVPRTRGLLHAKPFTGALASLEMLGEIVLGSENDLAALKAGIISYTTARAALALVSPPEAANL
jgi:hypothetical protein